MDVTGQEALCCSNCNVDKNSGQELDIDGYEDPKGGPRKNDDVWFYSQTLFYRHQNLSAVSR